MIFKYFISFLLFLSLSQADIYNKFDIKNNNYIEKNILNNIYKNKKTMNKNYFIQKPDGEFSFIEYKTNYQRKSNNNTRRI